MKYKPAACPYFMTLQIPTERSGGGGPGQKREGLPWSAHKYHKKIIQHYQQLPVKNILLTIKAVLTSFYAVVLVRNILFYPQNNKQQFFCIKICLWHDHFATKWNSLW